MEFLKNRFNQALASNLFFYRDRTGNEIDLVIQNALSLVSVEIKSSETPHPNFSKGLDRFKILFGKDVKKSYVIFGGNDRHAHYQTTFLPWQDLTNLKIE